MSKSGVAQSFSHNWSAVAKFENPIRSNSKVLEWAAGELRSFFDSGWLNEGTVLLASWSDYQIGEGHEGFSSNEPFIYQNDWINHFITLIRFLKSIGSAPNVERGSGFAEFIYRESHRKRCVIFERSDGDSFAITENNDEVAHFKVPVFSGAVADLAQGLNGSALASSKVIDDFSGVLRQVLFDHCDAIAGSNLPHHVVDTFRRLQASAALMDGFDDMVQKHLGEKTEEGKIKFAHFLALASATFAVSDELKAVCYIPGRGFLQDNKSEECSGGIYLWLNSLYGFDWRGILVRETIRCLRTSVTDWAKELNRRSVHEAKKSAIAAIFARNFSHVAGSHVISNPLFAERLSPELMRATERLNCQLADWRKARNDVPAGTWVGSPYEPMNDVEKAIQEEINNLRDGPDLWPMRRFHQYLQGRFDFIARSVSETRDPPEPIFFVSDLLDGFLEQTAFLDTFVADLGVRKTQIKFKVELSVGENETGTFCAEWPVYCDNSKGFNDDIQEGLYLTHAWKAAGNGGRLKNHDFLVGLPGGSIAVHAFFSLLENLIRNSIKYQNPADGADYEITIKVEKPNGTTSDPTRDSANGSRSSGGANHGRLARFKISICDSWSKNGPDGRHRSDIAAVIKKPLVNDLGVAETSNLGIQEMKLCAASLRTDHVAAEQALALADGEDSDHRLTYQIELEQPLLLGIVRGSAGVGNERANGSVSESGAAMNSNAETFSRADFIGRSGNLEDFCKYNCHILVVDGQAECDLLGQCRDPEKHRLLPYRILLLSKRESSHDDSGQGQSGEMPVRRFVRAVNSDLYEQVFGNPGSTNSQSLHVDTSHTATRKADESLILRCYREWLKGWKSRVVNDKSPQPWLLCVGLDRTEQQVQQAWNEIQGELEGALDQFNAGNLSDDLVKVVVNAGKNPINSDVVSQLSTVNPRRILLFDNHGKCFKDLYDKSEAAKSFNAPGTVRFYQRFGGQTPELFRQLSTPPQDQFAFVFFVYSLLESCLANVAVVDERLASSLLRDGKGDIASAADFATNLASHQKAGVFPVFTFKPDENLCEGGAASGGEGSTSVVSGHYKPAFESAFNQIVSRPKSTGTISTEASRPQGASQAFKEGIRYCPTDSKARLDLVTVTSATGEFETEESFSKVDVIVIHEGALDTLERSGGITWKKEYVNQLYQIAPAVIGTSGRGRTTDKMPESVPFIEFNIISDAILTSRNKYGLSRGLLGSTGHLS